MAMRSARPKALNTVSIWWWVLVPRRLSMCRVTGAWLTKPGRILEQVDVELADHRTGVRHVHGQPGTPGEVDHHPRQRLVQRHVGVPVAGHAFLVADGLGEGLAEGDAYVLDGMVVVDVQVAVAFDIGSINP